MPRRTSLQTDFFVKAPFGERRRDSTCRRDAHIAGNQDVLQFLHHVIVQLALGEDAGDPLTKPDCSIGRGQRLTAETKTVSGLGLRVLLGCRTLVRIAVPLSDRLSNIRRGFGIILCFLFSTAISTGSATAGKFLWRSRLRWPQAQPHCDPIRLRLLPQQASGRPSWLRLLRYQGSLPAPWWSWRVPRIAPLGLLFYVARTSA